MVVVLLIGVAAIGLIVDALSKVSIKSARSADTARRLDIVRNALADFVSTQEYLPCPANGAANTGLSDPVGPSVNCNSPDGTVPWKTLGIPEDAEFDGWNRRISYRVYAGNTGLTQPSGASMVHCDARKAGGALVIAANGLCATDHSNLSDQFLAGKGLSFNDNGATTSQIAFVLISHGSSGLGAWLPGGTRMQLPAVGNLEETANSNAGGIYYRKPASDIAIAPTDANHFDDVLLVAGIEELARRSGLAARDWPEGNIELTAGTTTNMTTASTNRFNTSTAPGGQVIGTTLTTGSSGQSYVTLDFAAGGAGAYYANCIWWPQSLITYNGVDRFAINLFLEFSTADGSRSGGAYDDLGGMVVGFLPKSTVIAPNLCGRDDVSTYLGWENNSGDGNLPDPRFGLEYDAYKHVPTNDQTSGHLSLVYSGVTHGSTASSCSPALDSYNGTTCYTGPANSWLRDGLTSFHRLRMKISPRDADCSGNAPKLTAWLLPYAVCADANNAAVCADQANLNTEFAPATLPTGAVTLSGCIGTPAPSDAYDQVYFGLTMANRNTGYAGSGMYVRNLYFQSRLLP